MERRSPKPPSFYLVEIGSVALDVAYKDAAGIDVIGPFAQKRDAEITKQRRKPPPEILDAAKRSVCPDCDSEVTVWFDKELKIWRCDIRHDDECVQLAFRQAHGALSSLGLVAQRGNSIDPGLVARAVDELRGGLPGVEGVRIQLDPEDTGFSRTEREVINGE